MAKHILRKDGKYSLVEGERPIPPPFTLEDKYTSYTREAKKEEYRKRKLIN